MRITHHPKCAQCACICVKFLRTSACTRSGTTSIMLCTSLTNWSTSGANDGNDTAYSFGQHIGGQAQ
eukprot:m.574934 g.574934  ORF g.574934 m.574934 type:complete len:67 (+) comp22284_c1_seq7:1701-1901(+)